MKNESLYFTIEEQVSDSYKKNNAIEELTFNVTEDILIQMEDKDISKSDLASQLGKTRSYISQLLSGSKNMTLRTLAEICFSLNIKPKVIFQDDPEIVVESKIISSNKSHNWQDTQEITDILPDLSGSPIIRKSNVIVRDRQEFWGKAA